MICGSVLCRDGWTWQLCGAKRNVDVHQKELRSHSGDDCERNLITFRNQCHRQVHGNG
jgi:hypothetical protein